MGLCKGLIPSQFLTCSIWPSALPLCGEAVHRTNRNAEYCATKWHQLQDIFYWSILLYFSWFSWLTCWWYLLSYQNQKALFFSYAFCSTHVTSITSMQCASWTWPCSCLSSNHSMINDRPTVSITNIHILSSLMCFFQTWKHTVHAFSCIHKSSLSVCRNDNKLIWLYVCWLAWLLTNEVFLLITLTTFLNCLNKLLALFWKFHNSFIQSKFQPAEKWNTQTIFNSIGRRNVTILSLVYPAHREENVGCLMTKAEIIVSRSKTTSNCTRPITYILWHILKHTNVCSGLCHNWKTLSCGRAWSQFNWNLPSEG